jgi:hypothetical protein
MKVDDSPVKTRNFLTPTEGDEDANEDEEIFERGSLHGNILFQPSKDGKL